MKEKTISLATLNLWRFYDWENRLPKIISLIQRLDPDVIFFQEAQMDISKDSRNQIEILNQSLRYPHAIFAPACLKTMQKGVPLENSIEHGLGVLSRFPFEGKVFKLKRASDDKEDRILLDCSIDFNGMKCDITNVHFSNSDAWADAHFRESLKILNGSRSIIAGDFNIKDIKSAKDIYSRDYLSSGEEFDYISYPADEVSYDQILIPRDCSFVDFQCRNETVSDHRLLYAKIKISHENN